MLRYASYSFISEWNEMNNIFYNVLNKRKVYSDENLLDKLYLKINITYNIT